MKCSRVYRSTDIGSDHYLVCQTVKLRLRNQPKEKKGIRVKYDTTELKNKNISKIFSINLRSRYLARCLRMNASRRAR